ncbi:hypothetical protein [Methylobacterium sp. WL8]|uniref:hypothetical protein n=1 Tax=Methylobacterium sp. WL8 TaxID=2603899 RepID=UPI0011CB1D50|nr:hypothetical protein [Methylobacterium sp. WL8]TXN80136.1 hypothetical protein FV234_18045 [Methylobacterium sp. WL8]
MSSISSTTASQLQPAQRPAHAHKNRVASEIDSQASAGTISSTDATALTSALGAIDASLKSGSSAKDGASAASGGTATARLDPSAMKDKIDGLIADQVTSGTLTNDQATTLKSLFAEGDKKAGGAVGGAGGRPSGPPPGAPPSGDASSGLNLDFAASDTTGTASTSDLLASFIKQLQATQTTGSGYASSGSASARSSASALVVDFRS